MVKHGQSGEGKQRYRCRNSECSRCTFIREYAYRGYLPEVKQQIADMAINGRRSCDTARVLKISRTTVTETLKKDRHLRPVNEQRLAALEATQTIVDQCQWQDLEAEADEMWSFVGSKQQQRWLWHAIGHDTGEVLAYVLSTHRDSAFLQLKALLEPVGIMQFYTDAGELMNGISLRLFTPLVNVILRRLSASI